MSERILRCPRCGTRTNPAVGECPSCGLVVAFQRHSRKRRNGGGAAENRGERAAAANRGRLDVTLERGAGKDLGGGPAPHRPTQRYNIDDLIEASAHTGMSESAGVAAASARADATKAANVAAGGSRFKDGPAGGEVEVGSMSEFLMDPSDDIGEMQKQAAKTTYDNSLGLGKSEYGEAEEPKPRAPKKKFGEDEGMDTDAIFAQLEDLAAEQPGNAGNGAPKRAPMPSAPAVNRGRYFATHVAPLAVLLLVVLVAGPCLLPAPVVLEGFEYKAVFSDGEGRSVTCTTRFQERAGEEDSLRGLFECTLYASLTSLQRIDEPHVLKPIMGDGKISYNGSLHGGNIELRLGSFDANDTRAVILKGKALDGGAKISGSMVNSLGNKAKAEITRPEF